MFPVNFIGMSISQGRALNMQAAPDMSVQRAIAEGTGKTLNSRAVFTFSTMAFRKA